VQRYLDVKWNQIDTRFPVRIYSEIDEQGWEQRKVELFLDTAPGYASKTEKMGTTMLGLDVVPTLSEISRDPEFEAREITVAQFEEIWIRAQTQKL
jgi:hypothetical protein